MSSKSIPILGVPFTAKELVKVDEKDEHVGETDGVERTIKVKKSLTNTIKNDTMVHEICHAILYVSGQTEGLTEEQEEGIVLALEHGLTQVMELKKEYRW
jgi:hypothetical protein